jgi:hypothetical protein
MEVIGHVGTVARTGQSTSAPQDLAASCRESRPAADHNPRRAALTFCRGSHDGSDQHRAVRIRRHRVDLFSGACCCILVVGATIAALGRRLPRVLGVAKLTLRQLVQPGLLAPQEFELAITLIGIEHRGIDRRALLRDLTVIRFVVATKQAPQETHSDSQESLVLVGLSAVYALRYGGGHDPGKRRSRTFVGGRHERSPGYGGGAVAIQTRA